MQRTAGKRQTKKQRRVRSECTAAGPVDLCRGDPTAAQTGLSLQHNPLSPCFRRQDWQKTKVFLPYHSDNKKQERVYRSPIFLPRDHGASPRTHPPTAYGVRGAKRREASTEHLNFSTQSAKASFANQRQSVFKCKNILMEVLFSQLPNSSKLFHWFPGLTPTQADTVHTEGEKTQQNEVGKNCTSHQF